MTKQVMTETFHAKGSFRAVFFVTVRLQKQRAAKQGGELK